MARRRRRGPQGPSLFWPMLVLILGWLGMTYWAYHISEEQLKKKDLPALRTEELNFARYQIRQEFNRVAQERLSDQIGFRGKARHTNHDAIDRLVARLKKTEYHYFEITRAANEPLPSSEELTSGPSATGRWRERKYRYFSDTFGGEDFNLQSVVGAEDLLINRLLDANNTLHELVIRELVDRDVAHREERKSTEATELDRRNQIETNNRELKDKLKNNDQGEDDLNASRGELNKFYGELFTSARLIELRRDLKNLRRDFEKQENLTRDQQERMKQLVLQVKKFLTEKNEYDGDIYYVDRANRWAYINLGNADRVTPGMPFKAVRYRRGEDLPADLAILTVKKVLGKHTAWCQIGALVSPDVWPQKGDKVKDPGFSRRPWERVALVGNFGQKYTPYPRTHAVRLLQERGFKVDEEISPLTQLIVLGADFANDPRYKEIFSEGGRLYAYRRAYQFMRPEALYFYLDYQYETKPRWQNSR